MMYKLVDWGCHDSASPDSAAELAASTKQRSNFSCSQRPALQRCLGRLPGRTPVLPRRVMSLRLEESQQLIDDTIESLHPYGGLKLPSQAMDAVTTTEEQQPIQKASSPSRLGLQIMAPFGNHELIK
ncbi:hypothetical protein O6H91_Y524700 [Diphasiastrum complanatum]|nr:hypothetical protein O6H91_Y524700 [Diphasiastrum complanatum]